MARAPRPGACKAGLEPLIGEQGCALLQGELIRRTLEWGRAVAPGRVCLAFTPPDAEDEMRELAGDGVRLMVQRGADLGERLAAASKAVLEERGGPLLVVATDLPTLAVEHAQAALGDLAEGCDVSFGPTADGGYYLLGIDRPRPELFALESELWGGSQVLAQSLRAAHEGGLSIGLLRSERDLDTPADANALLADPRCPPEIANILRRRHIL